MPTSTGTYDQSTFTYDFASESYDGYDIPLATMPAVGVFAAFADGPYVASPAWTEITPYVRQINIRRGRQDDLQQFPPGTAQLVLDNRGRLFDPFNDGRLATRTNLCPNPSFETNNASWLSAQGFPSRSTAFALHGSASLTTTMTSTTDSNVFAMSAGTVTYATTGAYTASAWFYIPTGSTLAGRTITASFEGGTQTNTGGTSQPATLAANTWVRCSYTARNFTGTSGTSPALVFRLSGTLSTAVGQAIYMDGCLVEQSSSLGTYFDGSSTGGSWTGVPNNSTSQLKVYRRNLIPNPSFETGTTSWSATGSAPGSIAQNTFFEVYGDYSCLRSVIGDGIAYVQTNIAGNIPISAGVAYTLSAYCRTSISRNVRVIIQWRDSANTFISNAIGVLSASSTTAFTRFTVTGTAPANAVSAVAFLETNNAFIGDVIYWDAVMLEQSSSVGDYFDGSLAGAFNFGTPQWEGTANASTSVMRKFPLPSQLSPRDQIKIVANWNGTEYPLYRGFIAAWPVEYTDAGFDSTVTISCFDAIGLMANEQAPTDWLDVYTRSLSPRRYWKCNDSQTQQFIIDTISKDPNLDLGSPTGVGRMFEEDPLDNGLVGTSAFITTVFTSNPLPGALAPANLALSFWFRLREKGLITISPIAYEYNGLYVEFSYFATTGIFQVFADNGTRTRTTTLDVSVALNVGTHLVLNITGNAGGNPSIDIYQNGNFITPASSTTAASGGVSADEDMAIQNNVQEISVFTRLLTASEIYTLYAYGSARIPETTSDRIQRVLNSTSWSPTLTSLTSIPQGNLSEFSLGNGVIPELQTVTESEGSALFASKNGVITFLNRDYYATQTRCNTSQMTFTDTGVGVGYNADAIRIDYDADRIRNDVNVQYTGDGVVSASDATSISTFGAAEWTIDTVLDSPSSAETLANRLVVLYKNPKMTIEPFMSKGQKDPSYNWPRLLALELLDRVTFKRTPATGSAIVKDLLVQSIEHRITPGEWQTVVNGSARYTNWFILGVSLLGSDDLLLN